jgi:WD40 repeat protein
VVLITKFGGKKMKYQAFISYKHSEASRKQAVALENALKKYAKPLLKPPIRIFRDEKEIRPGDDLGSTIKNALHRSEYLIYLSSKKAAESEWVQDEIKIWCEDLKRTDKLIIVLIEDDIVFDVGTKKIDWDKTNALPTILKDYITSIPVYVNLKWIEKDQELDLHNLRFRNIINDITGRFRGKTPAEMNDEQVLTHRKNIRLRNIAVFLLIMLVIISSALAVYAFYQKNLANEENKKSKIHRITAESLLEIPWDNMKAIRMAEEAYRMGSPNPTERTFQALSKAGYSFFNEPYYTLSLSHKGEVNSAVFSPDGILILTASSDNTAKLWDLAGNLLADLNKHKGWVRTAVFSPDGTRILTASDDHTAKLWDLEGNLLANLNKHQGEVILAVFSPDGTLILTASSDSTAKLWDLKGNLLADLVKHKYPVRAAVFSPDGTRILTASNDHTAKLWDLKGKLLADLNKHKLWVDSAVFSPDGTRILTASSDHTAKLWDLKGNLLADLDKHKESVFTAVFSPDGTRILTASNDHTAKLWDLKGNLLADLDKHKESILTVVFSPDGTCILTASRDGTAKLWYTPEAIYKRLKTAPIRHLTTEEKKELGID